MHGPFRSLVVVLLSAVPLPQQANQVAPPGFRIVTSTHGSFEYALPTDWNKEGFNSYRGPDGSVIEQIYPPASITPEYCASGGPVPYDESRVYDNGDVRGCYILRRNPKNHRVSFRFPSAKGIEDISITMPDDKYDAARVKPIIDSVRLK